MDFQQIKTGLSITNIVQSTIDNIPRIQAFKDARMNDLLYKYHRELLYRAMTKNQNKEVGFFWNLMDLEQKPLEIMGADNGFNLKDNYDVFRLVDNMNSWYSVVVMHNHPRNGLFSAKDIDTFADYGSIYMMTAVCNDGTIYMMKKEMNFNSSLLRKYFNEGAKESVKEANAERLRKGKKLGLDPKNPEDKKKIDKLPTKPYYYGTKNVAKHSKEIGITYRCSVKRKGGN